MAKPNEGEIDFGKLFKESGDTVDSFNEKFKKYQEEGFFKGTFEETMERLSKEYLKQLEEGDNEEKL